MSLRAFKQVEVSGQLEEIQYSIQFHYKVS